MAALVDARGFELTPDILGARRQGLERRQLSADIEQQQQLAPVKLGIQQAVLQQRRQGLQQQTTQDVAKRDQLTLNALTSGAQVLKGIRDPQRKIAFLQQQREQFAQGNLPTESIDEALQLAQQGDFAGLEAATDELINLGQQATRLTPRQQELGQFKGLPETTQAERDFKQQFGTAIGAIGKRQTLEERVDIQQQVGDIRTQQAIAAARGKEEVKLSEQIKAIPQQERVQFLSQNKQSFSQDLSESRNVLNEIDRAIEIWESAPGTISGPLASRLPTLSAESQELDSILAGLGIDRLSSFKGATSERELATAFRAGASIEQGSKAGIRRLKKQRADIERNNNRLRGLSSEANKLLSAQPAAAQAVPQPQVPEQAAPQAQPVAGQQAAPQQPGGQIMIDSQGNRAMVFPDGTFQELP